MLTSVLPLLLACWPSPASVVCGGGELDAVADIEHALNELEAQCGHFFEVKEIDWRAVSKQFRKEAEAVTTPVEHMVLLTRLLARLEDGHARLEPSEDAKSIRWPNDDYDVTGGGMFWCRVGKKVFVKTSWGGAEGSGVLPGMEVVEVDEMPVQEWIAERTAFFSDVLSFSTDHQADAYTLHNGLGMPKGTVLELAMRDTKRKKKTRRVSYSKAALAPWGPAVFPKGLEGESDLRYGLLEEEWAQKKGRGSLGYIQVRRCPKNLPELMDHALKALAEADGILLDFRGNSGGAFDHDALFGRFVPQGEQVAFVKRYSSAGPTPYGGPVVVLIDATVRSAGETAAGMFKEDGRSYMVGETPTAGMSSSKTRIPLPSGLFTLYVSVASNKGRFNDGRGIEGIGVLPHETVEFDPKDLAEGRDTLILRGCELLRKFPQKKVPYDPADFGWKRSPPSP